MKKYRDWDFFHSVLLKVLDVQDSIFFYFVIKNMRILLILHFINYITS